MKRYVEFDVREINQFGDAVDAEFYVSREEAEKVADWLVSRLPEQHPDQNDEETVVAIVIEEHRMAYQSDGRMVESEYTTLRSSGSKSALVVGGRVR